MTRPAEEHEISALIDGELEPTRAAEVLSAVQRDPARHAEFQSLAEADRTWAGAAKSAQFMPAVVWDALSPSPRLAHVWILAALALVAVAGRLMPKLLAMDLAPALMLHGVVLLAVIAVAVSISGRIVPPMEPVATTSS